MLTSKLFLIFIL